MKITDMLRRLAGDNTVKVHKWKVENASRWELTGATEPDWSGGAVMSYEDIEGSWRRFAGLELSVNYGMDDYIDRVIVDMDAPAWLVMPFVDLFRHSGLKIDVVSPSSLDIPF